MIWNKLVIHTFSRYEIGEDSTNIKLRIIFNFILKTVDKY